MKRLGVVHIISPEQAVSSPGMRLVCGDSQTSTAFGMLAHGIGTSEVAHMLGTQHGPGRRHGLRDRVRRCAHPKRG